MRCIHLMYLQQLPFTLAAPNVTAGHDHILNNEPQSLSTVHDLTFPTPVKPAPQSGSALDRLESLSPTHSWSTWMLFHATI